MHRVYTGAGFRNIECAPLKSTEIRILPRGYGINRLDLELVNRAPAVVAGLEVAGVVTDIGSAVTDFVPGDKVMSLVRENGFSELVTAESCCTIAVPKNIELAHAAALPEALFTTWLNLIELCHAKKGETVLITGAAGGVGVHAALIARGLGMIPVVVSRSQDRLKQLKKLGFENGTLLTEKHLGLGGETVDVILDILGPNMFQKYFDALRIGGRIAMIDAVLGDSGQADFASMFTKGLNITGSLLRPQANEIKGRMRDGLREHIMPALENGSITPIIGKIFTGFNAIPSAISFLQNEPVFGKVLVKV